MSSRIPLILALALFAQPASGQGLKTLDEVDACIRANIPKQTSVQTVEFVARDRLNYERTTRAEIYAKRGEDGLRKVMMKFTKPLDIRGSKFLMLEQKGRSSDMFVYTPEARKPKRITGGGASGNLFGTDFSYEDFERLQNLNKPGDSKLLEDQVVMDRPVYVVETLPEKESGSSYEAIVTYWDQKTCVALKTESFERGRRIRKELTADPKQILESGGIWIATEVVMSDLRDETQTRLTIESIEVDVPVADKKFSMGNLR